jgi:hypothetical protein|tara:strand:- start:112 stop:393 length:282 start_codon:yes stop_codon:yes gene_type:complete
MNSFERLSNNELQQVNSFWLTQVTEIVEQSKTYPQDKKNFKNLSDLHDLIRNLSNPIWCNEKQRRQLAAYTQVLWDGLREEQHREFTDFMMVI